MRRMTLPLALLLLLAGLAACSKKHTLPASSIYTFSNSNPVPVTLDIYPSLADYIAYTNRTGSYSLGVGDAVQVALPTLDTVWLDWYSADYSYNSWELESFGPSGIFHIPATPISLEPDNIFLMSQFGYPKRDTSRSILLNNDGGSSTWVANVSATQSSQYAGTHRFVLRRDFTCDYTFTDIAGHSSTRKAYFMTPKSGDNPPLPFMTLYITLDSGRQEILLISQFDPNHPGFYPFPVSRDTLPALFNPGVAYPSAYVKLIRQ